MKILEVENAAIRIDTIYAIVKDDEVIPDGVVYLNRIPWRVIIRYGKSQNCFDGYNQGGNYCVIVNCDTKEHMDEYYDEIVRIWKEFG